MLGINPDRHSLSFIRIASRKNLKTQMSWSIKTAMLLILSIWSIQPSSESLQRHSVYCSRRTGELSGFDEKIAHLKEYTYQTCGFHSAQNTLIYLNRFEVPIRAREVEELLRGRSGLLLSRVSNWMVGPSS